MMTRKLLLVFGFFFILNVTKTIYAQGPTNPVVFNEYYVSNVPPSGHTDNKGVLSDYVEIYNNHTAQINLKGFYLSNDRNNLLKWKFPSNYPILNVAAYQLVYLSGKNTNNGVDFHTNFTIEQCKNQWLILSNGSGVVYDSVLVQPTKAGQVRGRVDYDNIGVGSWRIFPTKSALAFNGAPAGTGYAPKPYIVISSATANNTTAINTGGFYQEGSLLAYMKLAGQTYDTASSCFDIFYTLNGDYPIPFYNGANQFFDYWRYTDSISSVITLDKTTIVRAIAVPKPNSIFCPISTLPSFCETNTYFIDPEHNQFDKDFGVISIALDKADTSWFNSSGTPPATIHVEYYDKSKQVSEGYAMINRPPQEEWITSQKGFYITKDDRLGFGCNFEGNIFNVEGLGTTKRTVFPALHLKGGDFESHSPTPTATGSNVGVSYGTGIRDVVMQSLAIKYNLHVSPLHIKPVVAFINGKYWGVYNLTEIYDRFYEQYYNGQSPDSLDLNFVSNPFSEGTVSYWDGPYPKLGASFNSQVYNVIKVGPMSSPIVYKKITDILDKESFIDYMILNSYGINSDFWKSNLTLAKGGQIGKPGYKWHFYLWNMPTIFNFSLKTAFSPSPPITSPATSPCFLYNTVNSNFLYAPTPNAYNGHGNMMTILMDKLKGNSSFQLEYKNRYQDLLNGPLKCENILKHYDYVVSLYQKEMKYHEDPASTPSPGKFSTLVGVWDTNTAVLRKNIQNRCFIYESIYFNKVGCFGIAGPYQITVDVEPAGAGKVRLNSVLLDTYKWTGKYYQTTMSFKAIPTSTDYAFHHWEISEGLNADLPLSSDSISLNFTGGDIVAVFTDKRNPIASSGEGANLPTGFTPNGDGINDDFRPLGSGEFVSEYQMTIWNRWGQEVFRSVDPLNGWDGKHKGQDGQTGVYAFIITYKNIYNEAKMLKGNVTLTR